MQHSAPEHQPIDFQKRRKAMQAIVGIWKDRDEFEDAEAYIRDLRRGDRSKRLIDTQ